MELNKNIAKGFATLAIKYQQFNYEGSYDGKSYEKNRNREILIGIASSLLPKILTTVYLDVPSEGKGRVIMKNNLGITIYEFNFDNFKINEEEVWN